MLLVDDGIDDLSLVNPVQLLFVRHFKLIIVDPFFVHEIIPLRKVDLACNFLLLYLLELVCEIDIAFRFIALVSVSQVMLN